MCLRLKESMWSAPLRTVLEERPLEIEGNTDLICWDGLLICGKLFKGDLCRKQVARVFPLKCEGSCGSQQEERLGPF